VKKVFCTISTQSHLYKCFALAESISVYGGVLEVLLVDQTRLSSEAPGNVNFTFLKDLDSDLARQIIKKYSRKMDRLRWSLKSVFLVHLLDKNDKVIYIDNDIHFFNDPCFLFDALNVSPVLLTPHHYPRDPESKQNWFEANFRVGLYNAGFFGANKAAKEVLAWWAKACLYRCEKNYYRGLFDDQKYLDLVPIIEPKTKIVDHLGCNVAEWNKEICKVKMQGDHFIVNENIPLIFYHFNGFSLQNLAANNPLLAYYYKALKKYNSSLTLKGLIPARAKFEKVKLLIWTFLNKLNAQ
jgi:hypothetical protein